jgi:membrane protease YdiL (CAAX protease family)
VFPPPAEAAPTTRPIVPFARLAAFFEVLLCSGFPTQLLIVALLRALGMEMFQPEGGLNPNFVFVLSMVDAAVVVGLILTLLHAHRESARDVLLGPVRLFREALLGIGMIPVAFFVVLMILAVVITFAPELHNVARHPLEDMLRNNTDAAIFAVVVMIAGGVREEVQRGFIVHRFGQYFGGGWVGVLFYGVLFGLGHIEQGYDVALATSALGLLWGFVYLRRGSIVAPMVSHAGFNLAQVLKHVALR